MTRLMPSVGEFGGSCCAGWLAAIQRSEWHHDGRRSSSRSQNVIASFHQVLMILMAGFNRVKVIKLIMSATYVNISIPLQIQIYTEIRHTKNDTQLLLTSYNDSVVYLYKHSGSLLHPLPPIVHKVGATIPVNHPPHTPPLSFSPLSPLLHCFVVTDQNTQNDRVQQFQRSSESYQPT